MFFLASTKLMLTVILQANVCISMATPEMVSASLVVEVHAKLLSSSSDKEPDDTICSSQCGVLWFTVK